MTIFSRLKDCFNFRIPYFGLIGIILFVSVGLSGCTKRDVTHLAERQPSFKLENFFRGEAVAFGIFEDRFGNLRRQFRVVLNGNISDGRLILDEDFLYEDGEKAKRVWTIENVDPDESGLIRYRGYADDVEGTAKGMIAGNGLNWVYDVELNMAGTRVKVRFDDWIYLVNEDVAINRAYVSKFGIEIGSVTIVFLRGNAAKTVMPLNLDSWMPTRFPARYKN